MVQYQKQDATIEIVKIESLHLGKILHINLCGYILQPALSQPVETLIC